MGSWIRLVGRHWLAWRLRRKFYSAALFALLVLAAVFTFFAWRGITAALEAREAFQRIRGELSGASPADLLQGDRYQSLLAQLNAAERSAELAGSRLRFLRRFTWLPGVGGRACGKAGRRGAGESTPSA